ncbi:hypothetical protein MKW94_027436, partial [Papaver nudicaule]|nr:hypothetical protein [Papaver nudicaule]
MSYVNFIDGALILRDHKADIHKFRLQWYIDDFLTNMIAKHLNTWITAALNRNVVVLTVDIRGTFDYERWITSGHHFLCNIFNCGTLAELKLKVDVELEIQKDKEDTDQEGIALSKYYYSKITFPKSMDLHCLKVLELEALDINDLNNLFLRSNCPPLLEYLSIKSSRISIDNCSDKDWFSIESFTLKYLELKNNCIVPKKIKLNVPNLLTFVCEDYTWHEYSMENITSLVCAHIEMLDFSSKGQGDHYLKLCEEEKVLCATRAMDFLKALDIVNELQLSSGILE